MRALILSCGPSLNAFHGATAGYDVVIGVNDVVSRYPVDWWVFGDDETITRNHKTMVSPTPKLFSKRVPIHEGFDARCGVEETVFFNNRYVKRWAEAEDWPSVLKQFSGPMALMLAADLGATEVDVWGVDMGGATDFRKDGEHNGRDNDRWQRERPIWDYVVKACRERGIQVNWPEGVEPPYPRIVTFMSGLYYETVCYDRFITSLQKFGLTAETHSLDPASWFANVSRKPQFILERMLELPGMPLIWMDIDSEMQQEPTEFRGIKDDIVILEMPEEARNAGRYNTAVIYFRNNEATRLFVAGWAALSAFPFRPESDQYGFEQMMKLPDKNLKIGYWPQEYAAVDGFLEVQGVTDPVIYQHQASRVVRHAEHARTTA